MKIIPILAMIFLGIYLPFALIDAFLFQRTIETLHAQATRAANHTLVRR